MPDENDSATYRRLLTEHANILASDETLNHIRSQVAFDTEDQLLAFIRTAAAVGSKYKDAQSCRIVELVSVAVSKSKAVGPATERATMPMAIQTALSEFSVSRCSSLLEAGAVAEHILPSARDAFLSQLSLDKSVLMRRYLDALGKLNPRIVYAKVPARRNVAQLILDWLKLLGDSTVQPVSTVEAYQSVVALLNTVAGSFQGERNGVLIHTLAQVIAILRKCAEHLRCSIVVLNETLLPFLESELLAPSIKLKKLAVSRDTILKTHEELDETVSDFLLEYLPLDYAPDPGETLAADELSAALLAALLHPSSPENLYQAISERILETDTEKDRMKLFLALEASLLADKRLHAYISEMPRTVADIYDTLCSTSATDTLPINTIIEMYLYLFEGLFQGMLPAAFGSNVPFLSSVCSTLTRYAYKIVHANVQLSEFTDITVRKETLCSIKTKDNILPRLSTDLSTLMSHTLNISLSPAGYVEDLFYQITNELVYDQFPLADRPARSSLLLMVDHYDREVSETFTVHLEDVIKREIAMGSADNMKTFSGNCGLLCTYCKLEQGKKAFASAFFNLLVEAIVLSEVIECSLLIEILNECMLLSGSHTQQTCKFSVLFNTENQKHWERFGLKTIVIAIPFSHCMIVADPILSGQLLDTVGAYVEDTPHPDERTITDILHILRYFHALAAVNVKLPTSNANWVVIHNYCWSHMADKAGAVQDFMKTGLLLDAIRYIAMLQGDVRTFCRSLVIDVDLEILPLLRPSASSLLSLSIGNSDTYAETYKALEELFTFAIVTQQQALLSVAEELLCNAHFAHLIRDLFATTKVTADKIVETMHSYTNSIQAIQMLSYCLHLSMCLGFYIFDLHPDACKLVEEGLKAKLPDALFLGAHLSPTIHTSYLETCASLADTGFDTQYCLLMALSALVLDSPNNVPRYLATCNKLIRSMQSLGEHGPRIVSAFTEYTVKASVNTDSLHSLLLALLKKLRRTDKNTFYSALLTLQETDASYAYRLTADIITLGELTEDLPKHQLCGQIIKHKIITRSLDQKSIEGLLQQIMGLITSTDPAVVHCCAEMLESIGRLRYGASADKEAYMFLHKHQREVANTLGSLLSAPKRAIRDAFRAARLVWMQVNE